jgi:hypothetical protein
VTVALLLSFVSLSAQTVSSTAEGPFFTVHAADIPDDVVFITLYTQIGKAGILYPYVIRFGDKTGETICQKQAKKVFRGIRKQPVESIRFEGFALGSIGDMTNDPGAQNASAVVKSYGLHDYGNRTTPVYYFKRED